MSKLKPYKFSELYSLSSGISTSPDQAGHGFPFVSFSTVFNNYFLPENLKSDGIYYDKYFSINTNTDKNTLWILKIIV